MKKILLGLGAIAAVLVVMPMFAAFEAHVVNVTATIENAMDVPIRAIEFGTVFPQEKLQKPLNLTLSGSFLDETQNRVNKVEYFIRQKPKCAITWDGGTKFDATQDTDGTHLYTGTGHIKFGDNPATPGIVETDFMFIDCGPAPRTLSTQLGEVWGVLPNLCPYLSKHSEVTGRDEAGKPIAWEDGALPSFHTPWTINGTTVTYNDVQGSLTKPSDSTDNWMIDLAVPCFGGYCAQDWESFVHGINPDANPDDFDQDISNEHKVFGCDLWVEVKGVSDGEGEPTEPEPTIDGVISAGEYDGALSMEITNTGGGTVKAKTQGGYLYLAADIISDTTDNRTFPGFNDEFGVNLGESPVTDTVFLGLGSTNANGRTVGTIDGYFTNFVTAGHSLVALFTSGHRVIEWKIPLSAIPAVINGDTLSIGGATESTDGNSAVYPIGLAWGNNATYGQLLVQ